jgi:hypothetical protein
MTPQEIVTDPNFLGLPEQEQDAVLSTVDKGFGALPPAERTKALRHLKLVKPGTEPEATVPPEPVPHASSSLADARKGVQIGAASLAEGLVSVAGIPSDVAELAVNGLAWLGEKSRPKASGEVTKTNTVDFPGGSEELMKYLPDALRVPKDLPPTQAVLSTVLKWQGSALIPIGLATKLLTHADPRKLAQTETLIAGGGGASAESFKQIYGESPVGEFIAGLVGVTGPGLVLGVLKKARGLVTSMAGLRTEEDIKREIGGQLNQLATPEEVQKGITKTEGMQKELGSEFKPTTGQTVGTPGFIQSERAFQRSSTIQADTGKRTLAQNQAVVRNFVERGAPEGKLADTVTALESTRNQESAMMDAALIREQAKVDAVKHRVSGATDRIVQQADARAAAAEDRAQTRINALRTTETGAVIREGDAGRILRQEYQAEKTAFETEAAAKYEALPDFPVPTDALQGRLTQLTKDFGVELQGPASAGLAKVRAIVPEVAAVKQPAGFLAETPAPAAPVATTFHALHQARNEVRRLRRTAVASQDYKSAYQLGELDDAIATTVDEVKLAPPPGSEGAVEALAQTDAWYGKGAQRLKAGEAGALRFKDKWGRFVTHDEDVAAKFLSGETPVNDFVQALGSRPSAREALRDYAQLDFYKRAVNPDTGVVKPLAASRWIQGHADALKQFPELAREFNEIGVLQTMATDLRFKADSLARNPEKVARIQNPKVYGELDEVTRRQTDLLDLRERTLGEWQKGITSQLMGLDADRAAGAIIRSAKPQTMIADLAKKIGPDADGQAGLTRALWEASLDKFSAQITDAVGNKVLKQEKMRRFLTENEAWMTQRFGEARVTRMRTSIDALGMLESTGRPVLPGGSDTMANLSSVLTDWGPFLSRLYAERSGRASLRWVISERTARIIGGLIKGRTEDAAAELLQQAFYDPKVAQTFMLAARNASEPLLRQRFTALLPKAYLLADQSREEQS